MRPRISARNHVRGVTGGHRDVARRHVSDRFQGCGRGSEAMVVGWATAESLATGCGADRDRMTSVHSRSSQVSCWRHWIRAWGRGAPVTPTIRPLEQGSAGWAGMIKGGPDIPAVDDGCSHWIRSRGCWLAARSAPSRAGCEKYCYYVCMSVPFK
jgi:hypothetical protein